MKRLIIFSVVLFLTTTLTACGWFTKKPIDPVFDTDDLGLAYVRDLDELKNLVKVNNTKGNFLRFFSANDAMAGTPETDSATDGDESGTTGHSSTNVQVDGVDEGDVIKTDGRYIYTITYNRLYVIEVLSKDEAVVVYEETFTTERGGYYHEMYITDEVLVVIGYHYDYRPYSGDSNGEILPDIGWGYYGSTMTFVKLYQIGSFDLIETFEISGSLVTSRLIENELYLISNHYVYTNDADPRPIIKTGDTISVPDFNDIKYFPGMPHNSFTLITHIDVSTTPSMDVNVFLGQGWGNIYVSLNAIYLATSYYEEVTTLFTTHYEQHGKIFKYSFADDGEVIFDGAGSYKGYVINQFAMDEHNGFFRMVTTEGWGDDVVNRLYVFEPKTIAQKRILEVVGLIDEGLGKPRETVRSVRFNEDTATVVTYELIDPFYVIDLSDPHNPTITGELEITGFSTYQHLWTDTLILGIGYEASGNIIEGIKLALYDIVDPTQPVEVGTPLILYNSQNGWQYGEALHNHKAILIAKDHDFIGFSINRWYYFRTRNVSTNDYIIFSVDPDAAQPIEIAATITHHFLYDDHADHFEDTYGTYYDFSIRRAIYIGDRLYVLSGEALTIHDIENTFNLTSSLLFSLDE